jgi:tRNA 2-selenouridine synthase
MAVTRISIEQFLQKTALFPVLDVRSPSEFEHAHIPGALSLPLFNDEERKVVGTAYKQQGKQPAIKIGLNYFGVKMRALVEQAEQMIPLTGNENLQSDWQADDAKTVLVHCWRGGMRSAGVAWLLDLYGFKVFTLEGGYKAYRQWVLAQFEKEYDIKILGGFTGSGKTDLLHQMEIEGQQIVDLEGLASHKGSAFGGIGLPPQPTQEMFENILGTQLFKKQSDCFWLEDESQRIGKLHIPHPFWNTMRTKPVFFIDIPFDQRLGYILIDYGQCDKEMMADSIDRIRKRLGPLETKTAMEHLRNDNREGCFAILLAYYDKYYQKGLHNRENIGELLNKIPASTVDSKINSQKLVSCSTASI